MGTNIFKKTKKVFGLMNKWSHNVFANEIPEEKIKNYFGEKIALYFVFLSHFSWLLIVPAIFGFIAFIVQKTGENDDDHVIIVNCVFCIIVVAWAITFKELWIRKEKGLEIRWG